MDSIISHIPLFDDFDFTILDTADFKEDSVREVLITPILKKLGYNVTGPFKIIRSKSLDHPFVKTGSGNRAIKSIPDYLLEVYGRYAFVLDAKAPGEEILSGEHREQAYFYAIHPEIKTNYYALCNGKEFVVFQINEDKPLLHFHLSEIEKYWSKIEEFLSPLAFEFQQDKRNKLKEAGEDYFDYMSQPILPAKLPVHKQKARRHFGVHGYFTKQVWNVVQEYIKNFTKPGDLVLDPYGGSGVTVIEALMIGRKGINIDLNPLAVFLVKNLIRPVDFNALNEEFNKIKRKFLKNKPETEDEIEEALNKYPYPHGKKLMQNADVDTIEELFTKKQLAQLAYLKYLINATKKKGIRDLLLISFSSSVNKFNRTFHYTKSTGGGDSSAFRYYRFRIAPKPPELDLMHIFEVKFKFLLRAKKEMAPKIDEATFKNDVQVYKGTASNLKKIKNESIDYIYTDPPYGSKIPYLDLSVMWNAWLNLDVTEEDYELEAIEGGEHDKSSDDYAELLKKSIMEMYRVLKFNRWMSFVFAHKDPKFWHLIVQAAEKAGFEYAGAVQQNNGQTSFKKRQNPFSVLSGQLIINFKKVKTPQAIQRVSLGADIYDIVIETIESVIARNEGASLELINDELIMKGLELGFLDILSKEYSDLTPILRGIFEYDEETEEFHIKKEQKFKTKIDVNLRIRYYLLAYLRRCKRNDKHPATDEIIWHIMPLLKNGVTPENQTILNVLKRIADRVENDKWQLKGEGQLGLSL
jgi:16S rRNA G966 N2-methylase RsmD